MSEDVIYFAKCENCKREIWDMISQPMASHLMVEFTTRHPTHIEQEHKRYCDLLCLQEWVNKSLSMRG